MSDPEQGFVDTLTMDNDDDATRLVYADWLEERNDPRAEYLRLMVELRERGPSDARFEMRHFYFRSLSATLEWDWRQLVGRRVKLLLEKVEPNVRMIAIQEIGKVTGYGLKDSLDLVSRAPVVVQSVLLEDFSPSCGGYSARLWTTGYHYDELPEQGQQSVTAVLREMEGMIRRCAELGIHWRIEGLR